MDTRSKEILAEGLSTLCSAMRKVLDAPEDKLEADGVFEGYPFDNSLDEVYVSLLSVFGSITNTDKQSIGLDSHSSRVYGVKVLLNMLEGVEMICKDSGAENAFNRHMPKIFKRENTAEHLRRAVVKWIEGVVEYKNWQ